MNCNQCGAQIEESAAFCLHCGAAQQAASTPAPAPSTPDPAAPSGGLQAATPISAPVFAAPSAPASADAGGGAAPQAAPFVSAAPPAPVANGMPAGGFAPPATGAQPPPTAAPPPYTPAQAPYTQPYAQQPAGAPGAWQPAYPGAAGAPPTKKKSGKLLILIIVAVVLVIAIVAALFIFVIDLRDPKQRVRDGLQNTFDTIRAETLATNETLGFSAASDALNQGPATVDYSFLIRNIPDVDVEMLSLAGQMHTDLPQQQLDLDLEIGLAGSSLLEFSLGMRESLVYLAAPGLVSGSYGVDLDTLGQDLADSDLIGGYSPLSPDFSFNPMQMMLELDQGEEGGGKLLFDEETTAEFKALEDSLWEAAVVEKGQSTTTKVNGFSQNCDIFLLTLPREAVVDYLNDAAELAMDSLSTSAFFESFLVALGADLSELSYEMDDALDELGDMLDSMIDDDIEATVYLKNNHAVKVEMLIYGDGYEYDELEVVLEFGGEKYISDAFTLQAESDTGLEISYVVSGHQVPADGIYLREIEQLVYDPYRGQNSTYNAEYFYDLNADFDNFSLWVETSSGYGEPMVLEMAGTISADKNAGSFSADLQQLDLTAAGQTMQMEFTCNVAPDSGLSFDTPGNVTMILDMSEEELAQLVQEFMTNLMENETLQSLLY